MKIMTFSFCFFVILSTISCSTGKEEGSEKSFKNLDQVSLEKPDQDNSLIGVWQFKYPYPSEDINEDHYMLIEEIDGRLTGWYYGTTDDFDEAREGYLPGFFVAQMEQIDLKGDTLSFSLRVNDDSLYKSQVPVGKKPSDNIDIDKWDYGLSIFDRDYTAIVKEGKITFDIYLFGKRPFEKIR